MSSRKRALLIASPFQGLRGPLKDVETMAAVLNEQGFDVSLCCGENATRRGILEAWHHIIDVSSPEDTVVIYYSGYGGVVEDSEKKTKDDTEDASEQPWRYQFLVPIDFRLDQKSDGDDNDPNANPDTDKDDSFTGILDVEMADLLRVTQDRTRNVTIILDCSYSGRMSRDPSRRDDAMPRNLSEVQHADITGHVARLRAAGWLQAGAHPDVEGNKHAVRIAAAASTETAWEHRNQSGQSVGVMTQALSLALRDAWRSEPVSWRTTLLRMRELVNVDFPQQNPRVEGPDTRLLFSFEEAKTDALVLQPAEEGVGIIQAGRVSGVREDNVYALMPFGAERPSDATQIGAATVTHVIGTKARAQLSLFSGKGLIPREGVLAFLVKEALYKWPVACPEGLDVLWGAVDRSKYLRHRDAKQDSSSLVEFRQDGQNLTLSTGQGVQLASRQVSDEDPRSWTNVSSDLVKQAEQVAKAQHLRALTCDSLDERLEHRLAVTFGTVKHGEPDRIVELDGSSSVAEGDCVYISLKNNGVEAIYVSVFDINVDGKISLISKGSPWDIKLLPSWSYVLGDSTFDWGLQGLPVSWPQGVPKAQPVNEHLFLILTDSPVDLRYLDDAATADSRGHVGASSLEQLAFRLATGARRDMTSDSRGMRLRYDTLHIPFTIVSSEVRIANLQGRYATLEWRKEGLKKELEAAKKDAAEWQENQAIELENQVAELENQVTELEAKLKAAIDDHESPKKDHDERAARLQAAEQEHGFLDKQIEATKLTDLEKQIEEAQSMAAKAEEDLENFPTEKRERESKITGVDTETRNAKEEESELKAQVEEAEAKESKDAEAREATEENKANLAHMLPEFSSDLSSKTWEDIKNKVPEPLRYDLEFREVADSGPCWTCTPSDKMPRYDVPLTIAGAPVVVPVICPYPLMTPLTPPPDPHLPISPGRPLSDDTIESIFTRYEHAEGFYVLVNGYLQIIVPDDFDLAYALTHRPALFGGLRVSYIKTSIVPTMDHPISPISRSEPLRKKFVNYDFTNLRIGSTAQASVGEPKSNEQFRGKIGVMTKDESGCYYVTFPTHTITTALRAKRVRRTSPIEKWLREAKIVMNQEIGSVTKSFDPNPVADAFPRGFKHDISLINVSDISYIIAAAMKSPSQTRWLSKEEWAELRFNFCHVCLLECPNDPAESIAIDDSSMNRLIGQSLCEEKEPSRKSGGTKAMSLVGQAFFKPKEALVSPANIEDWKGAIARALLHRVYPNFDTPLGQSGAPVCVSEDGTFKLAGFISFIQPGTGQSFRLQDDRSYQKLELESLWRKVEEGVIAFYGSFQVPDELRAHQIL